MTSSTRLLLLVAVLIVAGCGDSYTYNPLRHWLLDESLTTSLRSLPMRSDEPPRRASGYVERLLTYLDESL